MCDVCGRPIVGIPIKAKSVHGIRGRSGPTNLQPIDLVEEQLYV